MTPVLPCYTELTNDNWQLLQYILNCGISHSLQNGIKAVYTVFVVVVIFVVSNPLRRA